MQSTSSYYNRSYSGSGYYKPQGGITNSSIGSSSGRLGPSCSSEQNGLHQRGRTSGAFSSMSAFNNVLGLTSFDTQRYLGGDISLTGSTYGGDNPGNPDVPDDDLTDDNAIPVGDAVLPLLLFLLAYAAYTYKARRGRTLSTRNKSKIYP